MKVDSWTTCCFSIADQSIGEANADEVVQVSSGSGGTYLARVDAQLNNFAALWFDYHCKLQSLTYPYAIIIGQPTPWTDIPGTRRDVSWRAGKHPDGAETSASGISISMQAAVNAGSGPFAGVDVRMVCWGTIDPEDLVVYDYGIGLESAILTLEPVGGFA